MFMFDQIASRRPALALLLFSVALVLPACQSAGVAPSPLVRSPEDTTNRFSLRPVLDGAGYRPYYVGGYAGASYGPGVFAREIQGAPAPPPGPPAVSVNQGTWDPN